MWPDQHWTLGDLHQGSDDVSGKEEFQILAAPLLTTRLASQALNDSTDDSIDFLELLTKPEKIIESLGAKHWDLGFAELSNL